MQERGLLKVAAVVEIMNRCERTKNDGAEPESAPKKEEHFTHVARTTKDAGNCQLEMIEATSKAASDDEDALILTKEPRM